MLHRDNGKTGKLYHIGLYSTFTIIWGEVGSGRYDLASSTEIVSVILLRDTESSNPVMVQFNGQEFDRHAITQNHKSDAVLEDTGCS